MITLPRIRLRFRSSLLTLALVLALTGTASGTENDDFEAYPLGQLPPAPWFDAGQVAPEPSTPNPSAVVRMTTDAFGNMTQAVSTVGGVTITQGIYQELEIRPRYRVAADVRIDRYSDGALTPTGNWAIALGVAGLSTGSPAFAPQVSMFAGALTETWRVLAFGPGELNIDLGVPAVADTWYRIDLELEVAAGTVRVRIWEVETGDLLIDQTELLANWQPENALFNTMLIYEGETSPDTTVGNLATIDNVVCQGVFTDDFESGDTTAWN